MQRQPQYSEHLVYLETARHRLRAYLAVSLVAAALLVGCATRQPAAPTAAPPSNTPPTPLSSPSTAPSATTNATPTPPTTDPRVAQANDLLLADKPRDAARLLENVTWEHPEDAAAWDLLTFAYIRANDYAAAASTARKALALAPQSPTVQFNAGLAFLRNHQGTDAVAALGLAMHLRPEVADTYYNLGAAQELNDSPQQAATAYERGLALFPSDADLQRARAALRGDLTLDGKPERINVTGTQVTVLDGADGSVLARWEEKTLYSPPSPVSTVVVDLGGRFPTLLVKSLHRVSVHAWDGKTLMDLGALDGGDTRYDPAERTLEQDILTCVRNCNQGQIASVATAHIVWHLRDGKLQQIRNVMLPTK